VTAEEGREQSAAPTGEAPESSTLTAWLAHLEGLHPRGQSGIDLGLERVLRDKEALAQEPACPVITVRDTNG